MKTSLRRWCSLVLLSAGSLAYAQDGLEGVSMSDLLNLKGTVTASKRLQRVSEAPANVIVVTQEQIRDRGYMNVKDVLKDLPGMETIENNFAEFGTMVPVRGVIGNNKILLLINGMPVNPPGRENLMLREDQSVRFAKRVEIVYGPGSTLYGTDAVSAVINVITIEPDRKGGELQASYGEWQTMEGAAMIGAPLANGNFMAYIQHFQSDGMDLSEEYPNFFSNWRDAFNTNTKRAGEEMYHQAIRGVNLFASYQTGNTSFQYWMRDSERSSASAYDPGGLMFSTAALWRDRSDVVRMENNLNLGDSMDLKTTLTQSYYRIDPTSQYVFPVAGAYFYDDNKYGRGSAGILEQQFSWRLSENLNFIAGYEYRRNEGIPKSTTTSDFDENRPLGSQSGDFTYTDGGGITHTVSAMNEFVYNVIGVYAQADWRISDKLRAIGGVRYNEMSISNEKPIVPRLSLIMPVSNELTVKLIHAYAFVYPALYFQYNVFDNGSQLNIANPNLKPEQSQSTELNVLWDSNPWSVNASLYYNTQEDLFLIEEFDRNSPGFLGDVTVGGQNRELYHTANGGESTIYGFDSLTSYEFGRRRSAFLAASYVTGETKRIGNSYRLDRISNMNLRIGSTWTFADKITVSPRLSWRSDPLVASKAVSGSAAKTSNIHSQWKDIYQLDLFASWNATNKLSLFTRLNNLTNNKYLMRGLTPNAAAAADPFNWHVGANYQF